MRNCRKIVAFLLAVAVILGVAGCAKAKPLTKDNLIAELESYGVKENDKVDVLLSSMMRRGGVDNDYYVAKNEADAKELSNYVVDKFDERSDFDATDFVLTVVCEKGSDDRYYYTFLVYISFDDTKEAKKAYKDIVDAYGDEEDGKTGTKSNTTYCIDACVSAAGYNKIGTGVYLQGNQVIFLRADSAVKDKFKFADTICGNLGLPALPKAK